MEFDTTRKKFMEFVGKEKYIEFVLTLYETFPLRDKLFFWQEQLLKKFSNEFNLRTIEFNELYSIFNNCPIHDNVLKEGVVPIIDGNTYKPVLPYEKEKEIYPMANDIAPRNLEMMDYPESVEVFYCPQCRTEKQTI